MATRDSVMRDFPGVTVRDVSDHPAHAGPFEIKDPRPGDDPTLTAAQQTDRAAPTGADSEQGHWFQVNQASLDADW